MTPDELAAVVDDLIARTVIARGLPLEIEDAGFYRLVAALIAEDDEAPPDP